MPHWACARIRRASRSRAAGASGPEGGLAPGCIQVVPGGIEGLDEDRRGLGIERGHRDQSVLALFLRRTSQ